MMSLFWLSARLRPMAATISLKVFCKTPISPSETGPISGVRLPSVTCWLALISLPTGFMILPATKSPKTMATAMPASVMRMKTERALHRIWLYFSSRTPTPRIPILRPVISITGSYAVIYHSSITRARCVHASPLSRTCSLTSSDTCVPMALIPSSVSTFVATLTSSRKMLARPTERLLYVSP